MATYRVHLVGSHQAIDVDLPYADLDDLMGEASRARFIVGHLTTPDEQGVCRRVMIATGRIQCVIEA